MSSIDIVSIPGIKKISNPNKERIYDKEGFSLRASCIIWDSKNQNKTLLVKNKKGNWCIPGGAVEEKDQTILNSAIREVEEEAGITGNILNYIGNFKDLDGKNKHSLFVWNIISHCELENYKENYRERKWFSIEEALKALEHKPLQKKIFLKSKNNIYENIIYNGIDKNNIQETYKDWCQKLYQLIL